MRFTVAALLSRLAPARAVRTLPALGLATAALVLSGCTLFRPQAPEAAAAKVATGASSEERAAAFANSGATTTTITPLQKVLWVLSPYRPDIQQGNFISQEAFSQLQVGQTREQVRFLLGTPLLTDIFHADRWDYAFYLARGNGELTTSRVTVHFKDNKVAKIDGGKLPSERDYIEKLVGPPVAVAQARKKSWWWPW
jgi:outer membrane protein assembly factor BamE